MIRKIKKVNKDNIKKKVNSAPVESKSSFVNLKYKILINIKYFLFFILSNLLEIFIFITIPFKAQNVMTDISFRFSPVPSIFLML